MKARLLFSEEKYFGEGKYLANLKVYEVEKNLKFPEGIKAKFVLIDLLTKKPVLLIDNHQPFGFHVHSRLPKDKKHRERNFHSSTIRKLGNIFSTKWRRS